MRRVNFNVNILIWPVIFCILFLLIYLEKKQVIQIFAYLSAQDRPAEVLHTPGERYSGIEARQHYLQGKDFYSAGRYQEARVEFERALESVSPPRLVTEKAPEQQRRSLEIVPPAAPVSKEKAAKKKKEEKKKKGSEAEVTEVVITSERLAPEAEEAQEERQYYIDTGDVLDISVWQIPDLSKPEVIVRPDGKISFPLIGDMKAEGITLTQLGSIITEKLKTYVKAPQVSIMIRRFGEHANINKVVILGEVLGPGVYRSTGSSSIAEVIASAGGYTKYAVINSIMVIRGDVRTKPEVIRVNLAQVLKGRISQNITLKPNDIVYVPKSFIGNINTFLDVIQPAISEYFQTMDARRFHNIMHRNAS